MPGSRNVAEPYKPEVHRHKEDQESRSFQNAVRSTIKERTPSFRKGRSPSPSQRGRSSSPFRKARSPSPSPRQRTVAQEKWSGVTVDRRAGITPNPNPNTYIRSGSVTSRSGLFNTSSFARKFPMENWKSSSVRLQAERDDAKDAEHNVSKGKRLLKALLSRRRVKNDEMLYTYLDEY